MSDPPESTRRVLEAISKHLGVDVGTIRSRDRTAKAVGARWVAAVLLRERSQLTYRQLAVALERRVGTVHDAVRLARALPRTRELVEHVERMIAQETPRMRRAVVDVEEEFRRAREDAGVANRTRKPPP